MDDWDSKHPFAVACQEKYASTQKGCMSIKQGTAEQAALNTYSQDGTAEKLTALN